MSFWNTSGHIVHPMPIFDVALYSELKDNEYYTPCVFECGYKDPFSSEHLMIRGSVIQRERRYHYVKTGILYTDALSPYMIPQIHGCTRYNPIYYIRDIYVLYIHIYICIYHIYIYILILFQVPSHFAGYHRGSL